ncbi:hypothetical protein EON66_00095 [archaeon]|nr:MAG: hypothetical protein EON66_00095 [archaeon]
MRASIRVCVCVCVCVCVRVCAHMREQSVESRVYMYSRATHASITEERADSCAYMHDVVIDYSTYLCWSATLL